MKQLFKPNIFKNILIFLALLLIVKFIWFLITWLWLPTSGVDQVSQKGGKALYYRVKLTPNEISAPTKPSQQETKKSGSINDILLLAIYHAAETTVITVSHKGKTKVLSRGDEINGFVLEGAGRNFATFVKSEKSYKVMLLKSKGNTQGTIQSDTQNTPPVTNTQPKKVSGDVVDAGDRKLIDRSLVDHYGKNIDDVYKNIGIGDIKENGKLKGFQITFVRKDSPFAKLGVERGDVIKSINGQEINSYNAAFGVYKNIGNLDNMTLVIQRGNEEMELEYEIN
ncbi:MAG: PDZ domain-containing protein [Sulfurovum sp.]|nr:PDZ domain-containing protein [Sulfurovum sp.]